MDKAAYLFPGQGAQAVGMGRDMADRFPRAAELFQQAEEVTSLPLRKLCFEGPEDDLARTDVAQPAIFTVSAVALACLNEAVPPAKLSQMQPTLLAGLSLGEYTALYAAGALDFASGVRLVRERGKLMQSAATAAPSGMVSVMGLDEAKARDLCAAAAEGQVLTCANFNCPGQIVLSGHTDACNRAEQQAKAFGASGAVVLKVAGAFHSELMAPAADALRLVLDATDIQEPTKPVLSNVTGKPHGKVGEIREALLAQLTSPVRWQQCVRYALDQGVANCYEIGPGQVLRGLLRRIDRAAKCTCINSLEAVEKLAAS